MIHTHEFATRSHALSFLPSVSLWLVAMWSAGIVVTATFPLASQQDSRADRFSAALFHSQSRLSSETKWAAIRRAKDGRLTRPSLAGGAGVARARS
jgi:hypothetical protein